jgi:hypothetical protein
MAEMVVEGRIAILQRTAAPGATWQWPGIRHRVGPAPEGDIVPLRF